MRMSPILLLALLTVGVLTPLVEAQTQVNPVVGRYEDSYYVSGRIIDPNGRPVVNAHLEVEVVQRGVTAAPFRSVTNCFGDFIFTFTIGDVDRSGRVRITLLGEAAGVPDQTVEAQLDPFFRRSDIVIDAAAPWPKECTETAFWDGRITATGRIVNRTDPYESFDGVVLEARPYVGYVRVRLHSPDGKIDCPPSQQSADECDFISVDQRGDFRYSFVFPGGKRPEGFLEVVVDDKHYNVTVDPRTRMATFHIELTGAGAPVRNDTPAPTALGLLTALVLVAVASRNVLIRHRR